jgi:hypothetical protein
MATHPVTLAATGEGAGGADTKRGNESLPKKNGPAKAGPFIRADVWST